MSTPVKVDIWSDIACPFCYIGKRRFEAAVEASDVLVEIEFHSFELAPDAIDGVPGGHAAYLADRMGVSLEEALQMESRTRGAAAEVGIHVNYDVLRQTRTLKAHELLHHAKQYDLQVPLKERLMAAYFTEGRHVGSISELADLAAEVGLDRAEAVRSLELGELRGAVEADRRRAEGYGVRGVPFFVFDEKYAVAGAQDTSVFREVLEKAQRESGSTNE